MQLRADCRTITFRDAPELIAAARAAARVWRDAEIEFARALEAVDDVRAYVRLGCGSTVQLGRHLGLEAEETRRLLRLGQVLRACPDVEERLRGRAISATAAAAIAPVVLLHERRREREARAGAQERLGLIRDDAGSAVDAGSAADTGSGAAAGSSEVTTGEAGGADASVPPPGPPSLPLWQRQAEVLSLRKLRRAVRRELAGRRSGEPLVELTFDVTAIAREDFERARILASRKQGRRLTNSETFGVVSAHYVTSFDPLLRGEGKRRVGDTAQKPGERYVPNAVRRAVRRRACDRCEYPGCPESTFLQFAHRTPHREGSGREVDDLLLLCWFHHSLMDGHSMHVIGPVERAAWIGPVDLVIDKRSIGGREPETEAEREALRALRERGPRLAPARADEGRRRESACEIDERVAGTQRTEVSASRATGRGAGAAWTAAAGDVRDDRDEAEVPGDGCRGDTEPGRRDGDVEPPRGPGPPD